MAGTIHKHVARDGRVSWRVRVDVVDAAGKRHQPQRTFPTKREAEKGLRAWLAEIEPPDEHEPRQTKRHIREHQPTIYFVLDERAGAIKIGRSTDVPGRLRTLRQGSAHPPRLLGLLPGHSTMEARLHRQCAALRLRGEWFRAGQALLDVIAAYVLPPAEYYRRYDYRTPQWVAASIERHADVLRDLAPLPQQAAVAVPPEPAQLRDECWSGRGGGRRLRSIWWMTWYRAWGK
jgi:hypothetical protein